tara:strand:+ start:3988 stop:4443 length:456 start_codon:yes stop_codon:yes gene_type:complete
MSCTTCYVDRTPTRLGLLLHSCTLDPRVMVKLSPDVSIALETYVRGLQDSGGSLCHRADDGAVVSHVCRLGDDTVPPASDLSKDEEEKGLATFFDAWYRRLDQGEDLPWDGLGLCVCENDAAEDSVCCACDNCDACNTFARLAAEHGIYEV